PPGGTWTEETRQRDPPVEPDRAGRRRTDALVGLVPVGTRTEHRRAGLLRGARRYLRREGVRPASRRRSSPAHRRTGEAQVCLAIPIEAPGRRVNEREFQGRSMAMIRAATGKPVNGGSGAAQAVGADRRQAVWTSSCRCERECRAKSCWYLQGRCKPVTSRRSRAPRGELP